MNDDQINTLKNLRSFLKEGFYEDNLNKMANICNEYQKKFKGHDTVVLYILENIFFNLYNDFSERPVLDKEASFYEDKLQDKIDNILELLIKKEIEKQVLYDLINDLVIFFSEARSNSL